KGGPGRAKTTEAVVRGGRGLVRPTGRPPDLSGRTSAQVPEAEEERPGRVDPAALHPRRVPPPHGRPRRQAPAAARGPPRRVAARLRGLRHLPLLALRSRRGGQQVAADVRLVPQVPPVLPPLRPAPPRHRGS